MFRTKEDVDKHVQDVLSKEVSIVYFVLTILS